MKKFKFLSLIVSAILLLSILAGCAQKDASSSAEGTQQPQQTKQPERAATPITLKLFVWSGFTDEELEKFIIDPVKKKYPYITIQPVMRGKDVNAESLTLGGNEVDMLSIQTGPVMGQFRALKLLEDLTPLIKKNNVNLDKFDPDFLEVVRSESDGKGLYGVPYSTNAWVLVYNKDIFNKFGVAYPKDGMTWDEVYELAKKVTRNEGGTQYHGIDYQTLQVLAEPLSIVVVDPKTERAAINSPAWIRVFEFAKKLNDIPGNELKIVTAAKTNDRFIKDKNVAMFASPNFNSFISGASLQPDLNWDLVQYPSFAEKPNTRGMIKVDPMLSIPVTSRYKDEAMKIIDLVTSHDSQLALAKSGGVPVLTDPELKKEFGADIPSLKGKNIAGAFKGHPAKSVEETDYTSKAQGLMTKKWPEVQGGKDINTFARELEEAINQQIDATKGK
jgi:multiple sugar transport system substrate-binding protein